MSSANVAAEVTWNLMLAVLSVGVAVIAPGIFPPAMAFFALPFIAFAVQAVGRGRRARIRARRSSSAQPGADPPRS